VCVDVFCIEQQEGLMMAASDRYTHGFSPGKSKLHVIRSFPFRGASSRV
jgi:hypothetical protein